MDDSIRRSSSEKGSAETCMQSSTEFDNEHNYTLVKTWQGDVLVSNALLFAAPEQKSDYPCYKQTMLYEANTSICRCDIPRPKSTWLEPSVDPQTAKSYLPHDVVASSSYAEKLRRGPPLQEGKKKSAPHGNEQLSREPWYMHSNGSSRVQQNWGSLIVDKHQTQGIRDILQLENDLRIFTEKQLRETNESLQGLKAFG